MNKIFLGILSIILIVLVFGAGIYFNNEIYSFFGGINKNIEDFKKTEIGNLINQVGNEVLNPSPLKVNNPFKNVVLTSEKVFLETNIQRNINGFLPLSRNAVLDKSALAKANDMFKNQYFEHNSPSGVSPAELVKSFGYNYIVTGENLILGNFDSEYKLVEAWMNSPGHRANILNKRYTEVGIAVVKGTYNGQTTWIGVQEFGLPLSACTKPDIDLKNQIDILKVKIDNLSLQIEQKKQEIDSISSNAKKFNMLAKEYNDLIREYENLANQIKILITKYNNEVSIFNNCVAGSN
ncbi:MAG: hypothetical protein A2312_01810 [Candidatus Staskawiczbacteria bacterium RIFOXYB2_FULL_32_9]|uniref:SCP domain-containing protein n=1 Tax=Candidatus Staskawiczbacteria bacterium RIFOXYD1_FULL_32_13 TaxID=1802234 RepID=A0A1G2JMN7_9BACT|nr:MAG: hypothetical protein UR22_C0001G0088 [Parcubacteria group bacterium GW2011_GWC2_32_10]OGZ79162.1 MAG: hypothetical protein A2256_02825 [Candidatus Staskawiczbacteria bacterium RIFOXYA2_FULL_32_7]OGZ82105.1 MAG: hypothetical protein A2312_01810 [Candidatus Staskawiczbacteria bacterium RIFOXYB2_FULL_32_9]OGZ87269.1 MAG: hypothetical protein A2463_02820 [Candidatus Staskawiczbacteria bacterium RIFOXYC2_FULL_32_10]OGZ87721.1 MAG: hypothetical protein A2561_03455 [Candidatus Staskawiczbacter